MGRRRGGTRQEKKEEEVVRRVFIGRDIMRIIQPNYNELHFIYRSLIWAPFEFISVILVLMLYIALR